LLEKDNQLERVSLAVSVGFSVMALLIIVLVYTNARKTRKNVKKLSALNLLINEQKDDLEKTSADLRQSNRDKDRILQVVAHDLRNPVSGIMMLGSFLLEDETDPVKKETLSVIINASQSSQALINELLEYSGNALFEQEGKKEIIDINELVKQAKGLLQFKADEKQQRISITLFPEPLYINVFKDKINRLLGNLITNSIKFSPVQSAIDLIVSRNGDNVVVEVKDNGIGIPEKQKDIIFEPFTTAKRPGTLGEKSFGLGLSICKQIIGVNKGRIWVESIEGKGSSFFIELPLTNL
jgi:signal transduction histidine kinase